MTIRPPSEAAQGAGEFKRSSAQSAPEGAGAVAARGDRLLRALVVEDSRPIAERLVEMVTVPGRLEVAATAATEIDALAACDAETFDLAVVDLQLAQGTGFGVIRRLRAGGGTPPYIVVITNHAVPALKAAALEAGADLFLDKSKDFAKINGVVEQLLGRAN